MEMDLFHFMGRPPPPPQNLGPPPPPDDDDNNNSQSYSEEESINGTKSDEDDDVDFEELQKDQDKDDEDDEFVPPVTKKRRGRPKSVNSNSNSGFGQGEDDKTCKVCGKTFTVAASLRRHLVTHTEKKQQFECDICHTKFTQKPSLMTHMKRQHLGILNFPCPHCGKKYVRKVELEGHIISVHRSLLPTEKSTCTICSKVCDSKALLNMHMKLHENARKKKERNEGKIMNPHPCPTCGKIFSDNQGLTRHMEYHTNQRPFPCPYCPLKFRRRHDVTRHMNPVHLGIRNFVSKFCGREFARRGKRDVHDKLHEVKGICQPYKPMKIFYCNLCNETIKTEYLLGLHKKEKHPKIKLELGRILEKDIFKKEENGLRLVKIDKGGDEDNPVEEWRLCMKCGRAHKDEIIAKLHNETCEIPLPNLHTVEEEEEELEPESPDEIEIENRSSEKLARPKSVKQKLKRLTMRRAKEPEKKFSKVKHKSGPTFVEESENKEQSNELNSVNSRKTSKLSVDLVEAVRIKEEINESNELESIASKKRSKAKPRRKSTKVMSQRKKKKVKIKQKKKVDASKSKLKLNPEFVPVFGGPELPESMFLEEIECKVEPLIDFVSEVSEGETHEEEWLNFNFDRIGDTDESTLSGEQDPLQIDTSPAKMDKRKQNFRNNLPTYRMVLPPVNVIPLPSSSITSSSPAPVKTFERKQNFRHGHPRIRMLRPPKNVNSSIKTISSPPSPTPPPPPPLITNLVLLHIIQGTEVVQLQNQCLNSQMIDLPSPSGNASLCNINETEPNEDYELDKIAGVQKATIPPKLDHLLPSFPSPSLSSGSLPPIVQRIVQGKSTSRFRKRLTKECPITLRTTPPARQYSIRRSTSGSKPQISNVLRIDDPGMNSLEMETPLSSERPGTSTSFKRINLPDLPVLGDRSEGNEHGKKSDLDNLPSVSMKPLNTTNSSINRKTNPTNIEGQSSFPPISEGNYPSPAATISTENADISDDEIQPISPPFSPGPLAPTLATLTKNSEIPDHEDDDEYQVISPHFSPPNSSAPTCTSPMGISESDSNSSPSPPSSPLPTGSKCGIPRQKYSDEEFAEKLKKYPRRYSKKDYVDYSVYTKFTAGEDLPYECTKCLKKFPTNDTLRGHVRSSHLGLRGNDGQLSAIQEFNQKHFNVTLVDRENVYQCKLCLKDFTRRIQAVNHVMRHEATSEWQKDYMNVLIGDESTLTYQCKACLMTFKKKDKLRIHVNKIHEKVTFLCDICGISLATKQSLEDHRNIHTGAKPYKCKVCGYRAAQKMTLLFHKKSHLSNEERESLRLLCDECDFSTFSKQQFKYHKNQHLPEEEREELPQSWKEKSTKCSTCGKVFTTPNACRVHEHFQHASEKVMPFTCRICDQKFTIKCNAKQHVKGKHKKELKVGTKVDEFLIVDKSLLPPMKGPPRARYSS